MELWQSSGSVVCRSPALCLVHEQEFISELTGPPGPGLAESPRRPRREAPKTLEARRGARPHLNCRGANLGSCLQYTVPWLK